MTQANVTVLGAGVIGLTTALLLSREKDVAITVIAKHMPGDYDVEYASPWAGANYIPYGKKGTTAELHERNTWPALERLARHYPEAGVHFQETVLYNRAKDANSATGDWTKESMSANAWYKDVVPDFKVISHGLPEGMDTAICFTSVCMNTAIYLPWLASQCLKNGVIIRRGIVDHVADAASLHHSGKQADLVVNCTGLSSLKLKGVEDNALTPARGQIVVVRNDPGVMADTSGTDDGPDEITYTMHRAAGGGTILGGCYQKGSWESQVDPNLAIRIMKRCVELCPQLTQGKGIEALSVIRHGVGLRPLREGGARVEKEKINNTWVVHNYGHGGAGYQSSYGSAQEALKLVYEVIHQKSSRANL